MLIESPDNCLDAHLGLSKKPAFLLAQMLPFLLMALSSLLATYIQSNQPCELGTRAHEHSKSDGSPANNGAKERVASFLCASSQGMHRQRWPIVCALCKFLPILTVYMRDTKTQQCR